MLLRFLSIRDPGPVVFQGASLIAPFALRLQVAQWKRGFAILMLDFYHHPESLVRADDLSYTEDIGYPGRWRGIGDSGASGDLEEARDHALEYSFRRLFCCRVKFQRVSPCILAQFGAEGEMEHRSEVRLPGHDFG